ncbi:MAG: hypothetical protein A3J29_12220 [Acidobacteria bacterium RIFCSPLOWO2_12_FULL_67_14b]|nr:MAG: hypothetical protein A3J29_12220 [Acidobacteria bacterium RIFCSPLOWO2_12_FULL_67_14b]
MSRTIRVGARGSRLSRWQVGVAIGALERRGIAAERLLLSSYFAAARRLADVHDMTLPGAHHGRP